MAWRTLQGWAHDVTEYGEDTAALFTTWAARQLSVPPEEIARIGVEQDAKCSFGTCEYGSVLIEVHLRNGGFFYGEYDSSALVSDVSETLREDLGDMPMLIQGSTP